MLIFVLQTIWLYIKELAGKDLDIVTVGKFLLYFSPKLIPLVLPLTILLSSIMVFGSFAENYEFAAMKSTGISLQRAMRSLSVFIVGLGILTFFFANNVIPWAEYNSYNLRRNIAKLKPATFIAKGQFNQMGDGFNIKVDDKSGERGQYLHNVVIHQKSGNLSGNHRVIIAKNGELVGEEKSDILQLILFDGNFYDDTPPKKSSDRKKNPFTKSAFDKYTMNIDLSNLNKVDLSEKNVTNRHSMLNIADLNYTIDSLVQQRKDDLNNLSNNLYNRSGIFKSSRKNTVTNTQLNEAKEYHKTDSIIKSLKQKKRELVQEKPNTYTGDILDIFSRATKKVQLIDIALNSTKSSKQIIDSKAQNLKGKYINLNRHIFSLHEKIALGFACIILFFVGAPLGALIRKGGIGLPMVIAILLFLTYHFIGIFAKNSAKNGSFSPELAAWVSTLIMLPLGIYLTSRATKDRGIFDLDLLIEPIKKLFARKEKS